MGTKESIRQSSVFRRRAVSGAAAVGLGLAVGVALALGLALGAATPPQPAITSPTASPIARSRFMFLVRPPSFVALARDARILGQARTLHRT